MLLKNIQEISFDDSSATRTVMYYPAAGTKPTPTCLPQFGGGSIESRDGESFEGVGETRLTTGTIFTDKLFTGQREMAGLGIYHYQARFYSPKLGRFLSPDTIVPGYTNPQHFNRYSYVLGNPLKYTDPTGHKECADQDEQGSCITGIQVLQRYIQSKYKKVKFKGRWDEDGLRKIYIGLTEISGNGFNNNTDAFSAAFGAVTFVSVPSGSLGDYVGDANWKTGIIRLTPKAVWETVVHEMGHILDGSAKRINGNVPLRSNTPGDPFDTRGKTTERGRANYLEDFADSFLAVIKYGPQTRRVDEPRVAAIMALMQSYTDAVHPLSPEK